MPPKLTADGVLSLLTEEIKKLRSEFTNSLAERDAIIEELKSDVSHLRDSLADRDAIIEELRSDASHLEFKLGKLECLVDDADAYERRDTVILSAVQCAWISRFPKLKQSIT